MQQNRETFRAVTGYDNYEVSNHGRVRNVTTGKILKGIKQSTGYTKVNLYRHGKAKLASIHRLVAVEFIPNIHDKPFVDHIDGNKENNLVENLRWATNQENQQNTGKNVKNTSGFKGVHYCKRSSKYVANIRNNGSKLHIGSYPTAEEAHRAYCQKARELHGEFVRID